MSKHHRRKSAIRTEAERGLRVTTIRRPQPDVEALARLIAQVAIEDPLHLGAQPGEAKPAK